MYSVVLCTSKKQEAKRIANALVREKLAACVNIVPMVSSVYRWKGKIMKDEEALMVIKTKSSLFMKIVKRIKSLHSYAVPEIIELKITKGNKDYLNWITESTG